MDFKKYYLNLGFDTTLSGVRYIDAAVAIKRNNPHIRVTELEKLVAEKYRTTHTAVERCMRYAFKKNKNPQFEGKKLSLCLDILLALS